MSGHLSEVRHQEDLFFHRPFLRLMDHPFLPRCRQSNELNEGARFSIFSYTFFLGLCEEL